MYNPFRYFRFWAYKTDKRTEFRLCYKLPTIKMTKDFFKKKLPHFGAKQ